MGILSLITGPAARYLIGAMVLVAAVGGAYRFGVTNERNRQAAADLEQTRKQELVDRQYREQLAAANAQNQDLANRVETEANAARTEIEKLAEDNRRLAALTAGRLRDPNARACPATDGVPKTGDTARAADTATGAELSAQLTGLLLSESRRADEAATYAATCYSWIRELNN